MTLVTSLTYFAGLVFAVMAAMVSGCSVLTSSNGESERGRAAVVVLFDVSGSTLAMRQRYYDDFSTIVNSLEEGDTLIGDIATENTAATASYPIRATFAKYDPLKDNPSTYKKATAAVRSRILTQAKDMLSQIKSDATDLLSAPQIVDKVINGAETKGYTRKLMVFFTDGFQQTKEYDFSSMTLDDENIGDIISREKAAGRFPNLKDVDVWIVGAAASAKISQTKMQQLQEFWLRYFAEAGARCSSQQYATTLINFSLRAPTTDEKLGAVAAPTKVQTDPTTPRPAGTAPENHPVAVTVVTEPPAINNPVVDVKSINENEPGSNLTVQPPSIESAPERSESPSFVGHLQATSNADVATLYYWNEEGNVKDADCSPDSDMIALPPGRYRVRIVGAGGRIIARDRTINILAGKTTYLGADSDR